ncbi:MAG TPA: ABC transporter permease subunit [Longimicrobiales bacterium]|nr:ABC transporter permease subunit [Longimicrobiales bacterium]
MTRRPNGSGKGMGVLGTILRYELKMLLRDTRTLLIAVVAPLVVFPVWIVASRSVERSEERRLDEAEYRYAVVGSEAAWGRVQISEALALDALDPDTTRRPATFVEAESPDPDSALQAGELHLVVRALSPEEFLALVEEERREQREEAEARGDPPPEEARGADSIPPAVRALRLDYRARSDFSRAARDRLRERLQEARSLRRDSVYQARGFPVPLSSVAVVEGENVASAEKEAGVFLGLALTPFLLLLMLSGGSIVAVDAISGEKERGTLETLLTTAASRREIVRAKQLAVIVVGVAVAVVNVVNLAVYLGLGVLELPSSLQVALGPMEALLLFLLFLPLAVLVSAVLLLLSGVSKSYREYQIYFFPIFLAFLIPSMAPILPGMELRSAIALVPISGIGVAVREILVGETDWIFSGVALLSTGGVALWLARLTEQTLSNERLISRSELEEADLVGGAALFPRHVFRWFLGFWVVFFVISLWYGESLGLRGQVLVNMVGIFFGGSALLLARYRLPLRETLSLRAPHPAAWLATLIGAPSALLVGMGVAELVNTYVFPVPEEVIRAFGQSIAGPDLPLWQMVLFLAVMPGIFEEIAFRGVLLHGVRKRMGPWAAALAVGAVFGFFHVSLFRIVPTAFLGVILAGVVLLSRSLYPAILWHVLNNAVAVVPVTLGWISEDFTPPVWATLVAVLGLGASLWILWRSGPGTVRGDARGGAGAATSRASPSEDPG